MTLLSKLRYKLLGLSALRFQSKELAIAGLEIDSMSRKIKILIMQPSHSPGGLEPTIRPVVRFLPKDKYEVHVAAPAGGTFLEGVKAEGAIPHPLPMDYSFWSLPLFVLSFRNFLRRHRFDLIHLHVARAGLLGSLGSLGTGIPIVYTAHSWRYPQKTNILSRMLFFWIERFICCRATKVTCISSRDYELASKKGLTPPEKLVIIRNRIDTARFEALDKNAALSLRRALAIPENGVIIGTIASLIDIKDPETFVRTAAHLRSIVDQAYILWVGDGDLREETLRLARQFGIEGRVRLPGYSSPEDIPKWLGLIDVFLLTSRSEGLPFSILEAMAARRPVVASSVGAIPEVIEDGVTGWLFTPGNPEEAAHCVWNAIQNPEKCEQMVEDAYRRVINYHSSPEEMAKAYRKVYEELLEGVASI